MDQADRTPPARGTRTALKVALVSAGVVAGAIGATAIGASATTAGTGSSSTSASSASSAPTGAPSGPGAPGSGAPGSGAQGPGAQGPGAHGGGQNPNETVLTDAAMKAKLTAAAKAAVPGATVDKVETDSGDAKYEVHMTKAGGSRVTVKFDANLKQTAVEDGMGK